MGAAGLTSSTFEMCARGGVGMELDLTKVPMRETGMTPYELMLSESQERMVLVVHRGREKEVAAIFRKWGVDVATIGVVRKEPRMRLLWQGDVVADLEIAPLVQEAPLYRRDVTPPKPLSSSSPVRLDGAPDDAAALVDAPRVAEPLLEGVDRHAIRLEREDEHRRRPGRRRGHHPRPGDARKGSR